jgi:hypothetical protein
MNRPKRMTAAVAALAMCVGGSAFARDAQPDRRSDCAGPHVQAPQRIDSAGARQARPENRAQAQPVREGYLQPYADWHRGGRLPA